MQYIVLCTSLLMKFFVWIFLISFFDLIPLKDPFLENPPSIKLLLVAGPPSIFQPYVSLDQATQAAPLPNPL